MPRRAPDPARTRAALSAVADWVGAGEAASRDEPDGAPPDPPRAEVAEAVRQSLRTLEHVAPGHSVEVRVPPFGAVQCVDGPRHTRGTPPNVVETDPRTWLALATGLLSWEGALAAARVSASGHRAGDIAPWLPVVPFARLGDRAEPTR